MIKKVFCLSFLFLLIFTGLACAQDDVHENGFRGFNWGSGIKDIGQNQAEFVLLDFDRDKKLNNYVIKNDYYTIFDIACYPVYYHFWDDKFVAVRAYFDLEKDQEGFQKLYNTLVAKFGVSRQLDGKNEAEDIMTWQTGDTRIHFHYDQTAKKGMLYIYGGKLQTAYAEFLKTLPPQGISYKNQPDGFANIPWGKTVKELKEEGVSLKVNRKASLLGDFTIEDDKYDFMGIPVITKTYGFWQEQFFCAYVYYKSDDGKETFDKICQKLADRYGGPANGRYSQNENAQYYIWPGEKTHIMLYYFLDKKESYIFFVSKALYQKQQKG